MASLSSRAPIPGSERAILPNARHLKAADPRERVQVTLLLRRRPTTRAFTAMVNELGARSPRTRTHISRDAFAETYGADPKDIEQIETFAHEHDLDIVEIQPAQRRVVLSGTVAALSDAFGVSLALYSHEGATYRGRDGSIHVPADIAPLIQGVFGLDNRPQARPHFRLLQEGKGAIRAHVVQSSFTPPQIAQLYNFPTGVTGSGECIAIIELGGGYHRHDLSTYFTRLGVPTPRVRSKSVDGSHNAPEGDPNSPDGEVLLDVEVAGAVAPGAKIVVYFAPNTDAGFLDAILTAIHDTRNTPSVVSISWGAAESDWTQQAMQAMDHAFQDAAALGVTICCASGDDGSSDRANDGRAHVDFPASSPYVLGCGGTKLEGTGRTITSEVAWNEQGHGATGGGVSEIFMLPAWQAGVHVPPSVNPRKHLGRGVPDVAGDADPLTGYQVLVDGQVLVIGGTSAVAPLWAGLIALCNQQLGHAVGYLNPVLYALPAESGAFHDIVNGNNGAYTAGAGWDACTGLGSPDGTKLLSLLAER